MTARCFSRAWGLTSSGASATTRRTYPLCQVQQQLQVAVSFYFYGDALHEFSVVRIKDKRYLGIWQVGLPRGACQVAAPRPPPDLASRSSVGVVLTELARGACFVQGLTSLARGLSPLQGFAVLGFSPVGGLRLPWSGSCHRQVLPCPNRPYPKTHLPIALPAVAAHPPGQ